MEILKVSGKSNPAKVAGAIARDMRENGKSELQAVGAGAVSQAVKAIAVARGYLSPQGIELMCIPSFVTILIDGEDLTAIKFSVVKR